MEHRGAISPSYAMGSGIRYCPQHEWLGAGIDFLPVKELSLSRLKETLKIAGKSPVTSLSFKHWKTWLSLLIFNYDASFQKYKLRKHCVLTVRNSWNFSNLHPKYCHLKTNKQTNRIPQKLLVVPGENCQTPGCVYASSQARLLIGGSTNIWSYEYLFQITHSSILGIFKQKNKTSSLGLDQLTPITSTQEIQTSPCRIKKRPNLGVKEDPKFTHLSSVKLFPVITFFPWGT